MSLKHCAFLTLDDPGDYVIDDEHAIKPLAELGWSVSTKSWRQTKRRWSTFDIVVIRSTWDYWYDVPAFLEILADIDRETLLVNPLELVRWNLEKTYLRDLESRGVRIVPTVWLDRLDVAELADHAARLENDHLVIKPQVGANGDDAFRLSPADDSDRLVQITKRFDGRASMIQPFRQQVLTEGEFSLFYFNGQYSHAILKTPAAGEFRSQEERGGRISGITPEPLLARRGQQVLAAVSPRPLYARADFVRNESGDFELMELELIEPSLYLRTDADAPQRLAKAIDDCLA